MKILNLACGTKTSKDRSVVNIDWSIMLRIRTNTILRAFAPLLLRGDRLQRFLSLPENIMLHDLSRGIPFPDAGADAVYHSHVLEHFDRSEAPKFIQECARVLRPGGVIRVVVPDFERHCRNYMNHVSACEKGGEIAVHDSFVEPLLMQSVIREAYGSSQQRPVRRFVENLLLGDARSRGETHQWMYDRFNLAALLLSCGFIDPVARCFDQSAIDGWDRYGLDRNESGNEYKPGSLYMEATRSI